MAYRSCLLIASLFVIQSLPALRISFTTLNTPYLPLYSTSTSCEDIAVTLLDRQRGALMGFYIADALAMPTHWMYNRQQLRDDYGFIQGYVAPKDILKDSKLMLRYRYDKVIANSMILHNKRHLWRIESSTKTPTSTTSTVTPSIETSGEKQQLTNSANSEYSNHYHYHFGLCAGENTLEAMLARLLTRHLIQHKTLKVDTFLRQYIQFMTTPGTHNDSYVATCHRMFFYNYYYNKLPPEECADNDYHNIDSIDGLVLIIPVIFQYYSASRFTRLQAIKQTIYMTRKTRALDKYAELYCDMLMSVLQGTSTLREAVEHCGRQLSSNDDDDDGLSGFRSIKYMVENNNKDNNDDDPTTACYIQPAFISLLYLAYKYADSDDAVIGLLANANTGGENVARGCLLGTLLGAAHGYNNKLPEWSIKGLVHHIDIESEIKELLLGAGGGRGVNSE